MPSPSQRSTRIIAFALVYIIWGSTYLAIRYAIQTIPPFLMAGTRFLIAGTALYLWIRVRNTPKATAKATVRTAATATARQWKNAAIIGLLLLLCGNGGVVWAEQTVSSGIAALIVAVVPLWMVLLDWLRPHGVRPRPGVILGVIVGLLGVVELVGLDAFRGHASNVDPIGVAVLMAGSFMWAAGSLFARSADLPDPILTTAMEMMIGGVGLLVAAIVTGEMRNFDWHAVSLISIAGILYLITFGSLVAYTAYTWLVRNASPAAVGTYAYVNPVVAVFLGWLIAHEQVTRNTVIGAAVILAAVAIITTTKSQPPKETGTSPAEPTPVTPRSSSTSETTDY